MRKKTPIGKYNPIIQIRWEYRKLEKQPYPHILQANAQRIRADSSALPAPIDSSLYSSSHDRLFCICLISGKLAFELRVPWSYLIDLTDI